jgi:putative nucleotidyltransferase with HDIG domain
MQALLKIISPARRQFTARELALAAYVVLVVGGSLAVAAALIHAGFGLGNPVAVAGLATIAGGAERGHVQLSRRVAVSVSLLPALFAAILFGPLASMAVFAASMLARRKIPLAGRLAFMGSRALTGALTAAVAAAVAKMAGDDVTGTVLVALAAGVTAELMDVGFASITFRLRGHGQVREAMSALAPVVVASIPFYTPVVALLALAYEELSPWTAGLFFVPAVAAQRWFVLYQDERRLAQDLASANERLEQANLSFATALVATLDARDRYTAGHSAAVAIYARAIACRLGLSEADQQLAHLAGLVHDIGKIGLPAGLLEKPGALTLDERRQMEQHSIIGERILRNVETYSLIAEVVRHHHERVDGQGYPDGRAGEEIPLLARIVSVADAYNAMTSDRPYRNAMPSRVARLRLAQAVESQFDTTVVAVFEAILAASSESYRLARDPEFRFELHDENPVERGQLKSSFALHVAAHVGS